MKIKDIMAFTPDQFNKLTDAELRKVTSSLISAANKRVRRLENAGQQSPALSHVMQHGGRFSIKGKTFNQVRAEYARTRKFLESETGNLRGARRVENRVISGLNNAGVNINSEQYNEFWKAYEKLKDLSPEVANTRFKYMAMKELSNRMESGKSPEEIAEAITKDFSRIYEEEEQLTQDLANVSEFFETDENI